MKFFLCCMEQFQNDVETLQKEIFLKFKKGDLDAYGDKQEKVLKDLNELRKQQMAFSNHQFFALMQPNCSQNTIENVHEKLNNLCGQIHLHVTKQNENLFNSKDF